MPAGNEKSAPSGKTLCTFPPALGALPLQEAFGAHLQGHFSHWYKNPYCRVPHLGHCMATMRRGAPSNWGVSVSTSLSTLFLPPPQHCAC